MDKVTVNIESSVNNDGVQALALKEEIIVFYKLGFLDAYMMCNNLRISGNNKKGESRESKLFQRISEKCKKRFEARFMKNIDKQIKKVKK